MIHGLGRDVELPDMRGAVAEGLQLERQAERGAIFEGLELVVVVGVAELAVGVVVQAGQDDRAAGLARRGGGVGAGEAGAFLGEGVEMRRPDQR